MSSKTARKPKSIETDGRLVQTRIPPEDYASVEQMAKGSRLSMASMLRTMIASQADAYRAAQKSARSLGDEELGSLLADDILAGSKIVSLTQGSVGEFGENDELRGIGIYGLTAAGTVLALCRATGEKLQWVKVDAARSDLKTGALSE